MTETSGPLPERIAAMRTSPRFLLIVAGRPRTIAGVMPPSFRYPDASTQAWIPAQMSAGLLSARHARFYTAVGRLKASVTREAAQADLSAIQRRLGETFPETDRGWIAGLVPLKEEQVAGMRRSLWLLFGAVTLVLLAACSNVACLLLADGARREHELAVRFAPGAPRSAIVRQLLREGLVLAGAGALGGLLVARWATGLLRSAARELPPAAELAVDVRLIAFTLCLAVTTTMLFALLPAMRATRRDVAERLARGARSQVGRGQRLQRALVAVQIALAVVLLIGAVLLIRSIARLQQVSPGFDAQGVLTFRMSASWGESPESVGARQVRTLDRLRTVPGVMAASISNALPAGADYPPSEFTIGGQTRDDTPMAVHRQVSAGYFGTLRIPLLEGAICRDDPRPDAPPTVVISRSLADRYFPGEAAIGRHIGAGRSARIVGIVGDAREQGLMTAPKPTLYRCGLLPYWPDPFFLVRIAPEHGVTMSALRGALREIEPGRAVYSAAALTESLSASLAQPRLNTILLGLFAAMALLLVAVGVHGMLAQFVAQRRREIGLRVALGARPVQLVAQIGGHSARVTLAGVALGLAGASLAAELMTSLVFELSPRDQWTYGLVSVVLTVVAAAATIIPVRRAVRLDPIKALREER